MSSRNPSLSSQSTPRPTRALPNLRLLQLWAVALLFGICLLLEGFSRTAIMARLSPVESLGVNPSPMGSDFEIKWYRLQEYVAQNGGVDVILIGSSVVNTGIDPEVVAATYFEQTGKRLRIFNFGVEGLGIVPNSVYAKILVRKYHPALLIFGTIPRDFLASDNQDINPYFLTSPWIEYQSGGWNLTGWLISHSAFLRHYLPYRNWMRSDFLELRYAKDHRLSRTSPSGYEPDHFIALDLETLPNPNDPNEAEKFAKYRDYKIDPGRLARLQEILSLGDEREMRVIVMDMPLHPSFYTYLGGQDVYAEYQRAISDTVAAAHALFIPAKGEPEIPPDGRPDREHLNQVGAPVLSVYLGSQLAALTQITGIQFVNTGYGGQ